MSNVKQLGGRKPPAKSPETEPDLEFKGYQILTVQDDRIAMGMFTAQVDKQDPAGSFFNVVSSIYPGGGLRAAVVMGPKMHGIGQSA